MGLWRPHVMEPAQSFLPTFSLASHCAGFCLWAVQQVVLNGGTHIHHFSSCSILLGTTDSFINMKKRQSNECVSVPWLTFSTERQTRGACLLFDSPLKAGVLKEGEQQGNPEGLGFFKSVSPSEMDQQYSSLESQQWRKTWMLLHYLLFLSDLRLALPLFYFWDIYAYVCALIYCLVSKSA